MVEIKLQQLKVQMTATFKSKSYPTPKARGLAKGYRSGLEEINAAHLIRQGIDAEYEVHKIAYTPPLKERTYTPDWVLPNGVIIETKGQFDTADRQKHKMIQTQHPLLDIRFVFSKPSMFLTTQKDKEFRKWLITNHGIKVVSQIVKDRFKPEFFKTLKTKPSQTTYADWCIRYGFQYATELIPIEWLKEAPDAIKIDALQQALKK